MSILKDLRPLSTGEAATFCHVSQVAIYKWIKEGKLKAHQTPGNHHRIQVVDFIKFLKRYGMPIPEELLTPSKQRILIVDDEPGVIGFITRALQDMDGDYQIASALDGYTAGEKVTNFRPHLIILDLRMPGMDGFEVCQRIKANPGCQVTPFLTRLGDTNFYELFLKKSLCIFMFTLRNIYLSIVPVGLKKSLFKSNPAYFLASFYHCIFHLPGCSKQSMVRLTVCYESFPE